MRLAITVALTMTLIGCANFDLSHQGTTTTNNSASKSGASTTEALPPCNASAWQLDGLLWFDASKKINNRPEQAVFDSAGRQCLMQFK